MATIVKEFEVPASAEAVWDVVRDFGRVERLAPGFVTSCTVEEAGAVRALGFFNGLQAKERLVTLDESGKRLAYTAFGGRTQHHYATAQIVPLAANRCRFVWTTDLLPDALAPAMEQMMARGAEVMRSALTPPAR